VIDVRELPFDQYQRYRLVADLVAEIRPQDRPLSVLDVGGRTALLRSFLPDDRIVLVDLESSDEPGLVLGDGAALPFRDGAFDLVTAFDTLEHVPSALRAAFVNECARVSRSWVFLAGPYGAPEVDEAEERLRDFLREKLSLEHRYLEEHRRNGLPDREQVQAWLAASGAHTRSFGHGNLDRWLVLMCLEMYMDHDPGLRPIAARFFRFYNERLFASDHRAPVYRHALAAAFGESPLPRGDWLQEPAAAPEGSVSAVTDLAVELLAFDRERDVWQVEFERLRGEVAAARDDVAGHKARLADTQADLEEHRNSLADLGRELDEARARHEHEISEHERTAAGLAAEADALRAHQGGLEGQLRETQAGAEAIQAELLAARMDIEGLVRDLAAAEGTIAELRRELRDRWHNLKRAFGKKPTF